MEWGINKEKTGKQGKCYEIERKWYEINEVKKQNLGKKFEKKRKDKEVKEENEDRRKYEKRTWGEKNKTRKKKK
jgi:hypothetical protein